MGQFEEDYRPVVRKSNAVRPPSGRRYSGRKIYKAQPLFENLTPMTPSSAESEKTLEEELRSWWKQVESEAEALVDASSGRNLPGGKDLWDGMPVIDSKVVTETSPIFERKLGIPLDPREIRPGGYSDIEDMISDLVPKMRKRAQSRSANEPEKRRDEK